ncbi:MAG: NUDIX hydrolase [Nostocales cyanobacterium ELA583]|jgi:ADP-ribose pyrophosphatase
MSFKPQANLIGWHLIESNYIHQSQWFNLRQDRLQIQNDQELTYTYVEHPGSVFVVPVTENSEIILIHSYRYTIDSWCWEVPAGSLGDKDVVDPVNVAHQELAEEIGGETESMEDLGCYYMANGFASLQNHFFIAHGTKITQPHRREDTEIIKQVVFFPIEKTLKMVQSGEINDGESAFAILLASMSLRLRSAINSTI